MRIYDFANSIKKPIINLDEFGESLFLLKDKSIETVYFPKVFELSEASSVNFNFNKIEIKKYENAQIYSDSDFINIKEGIIWEKYFTPQWTKLIPFDSDLLKIQNDNIRIKHKRKLQIIENGFSLCGVHSTVWAHFIVQFLPKLYQLKEILLYTNSDLTIILPKYNDLQIREIVFDYLKQFKNIKVLELKKNSSIYCKNLFFVPITAKISDNATYINPSDIIIPKFTIDILAKNLVKVFFKSNNFKKPFRKIYIGRIGSRNLSNNSEVENYFLNQGFELIYPINYSLQEKVKIFNEASFIVGPGSSGFTNIIFCQPGTKALVFINFQRTFDSYFGTICRYFSVNPMFVTGFDESDSIHSAFTIPLDKIKSAYFELLNEKSIHY